MTKLLTSNDVRECLPSVAFTEDVPAPAVLVGILLNVSSVGHNDYKLMVHSCWRLTPGLRTTTTPASWLKLVSRLVTAPPTSSVARPAVDTVRESWPSTDTLYSHTSVLYEPEVGSY